MSRLITIAFSILGVFSEVSYSEVMQDNGFARIYSLIEGSGLAVSCVDEDTKVELRVKLTSRIDLDVPIRTYAIGVSETQGDVRYYITGAANLIDSTSAPRPSLSFVLNVGTATRKPSLSFFYKDGIMRAHYFGMLYNFYAPFCSYSAIPSA